MKITMQLEFEGTPEALALAQETLRAIAVGVALVPARNELTTRAELEVPDAPWPGRLEPGVRPPSEELPASPPPRLRRPRRKKQEIVGEVKPALREGRGTESVTLDAIGEPAGTARPLGVPAPTTDQEAQVLIKAYIDRHGSGAVAIQRFRERLQEVGVVRFSDLAGGKREQFLAALREGLNP